MTNLQAPVLVAAAALAAGRNPRDALEKMGRDDALAPPAQDSLTTAQILAGRIAVAVHSGASSSSSANSGDDDPLALLPQLLAIDPAAEGQSVQQLKQLQDLLALYYNDAEEMRLRHAPSLWARLTARFG